MEKKQKLLTRLARMSSGIFGIIIVVLFAVGYHRSAVMMFALGSTIGTATVMVAVVLFAIREKPISLPKQTEAAGAGQRALDSRPKL